MWPGGAIGTDFYREAGIAIETKTDNKTITTSITGTYTWQLRIAWQFSLTNTAAVIVAYTYMMTVVICRIRNPFRAGN